MDIRKLNSFVAAAEEGNITRAAERLYISQPALSKQLMELEKELDSQLFIRGKRKIVLTDAGNQLLRRAREILGLIKQTESEIGNIGQLEGYLNIGGGVSMSFSTVAVALKRFHEAYPRVTINLYSGNSEDTIDDVRKGLLSFGMVNSRARIQDFNYVSLPVRDVWGLQTWEGNPLCAQGYATPDDVCRIPLIVSRGMLARNELAGWLGKSIDEMDIAATTDLGGNLPLMIKIHGASALSYRPVALEGCRFLPLNPPVYAENVLMWKKGQALSRIETVFLSFINEEIETDRNIPLVSENKGV